MFLYCKRIWPAHLCPISISLSFHFTLSPILKCFTIRLFIEDVRGAQRHHVIAFRQLTRICICFDSFSFNSNIFCSSPRTWAKVCFYFIFFPQIQDFCLRIVHIHDAKTLKIRPFWHVLLHYFITRPSIKNLYDTFLTKWPRMWKM